ncbi:MAG: CPBP family intramembrane glutamic endopeptidase [Promethearchaeota archaeon]
MIALYLTLYIFILSPIFIDLIGDSNFISLGLGTIIYLIPLIYVRKRDQWTSKDLGSKSEVKSWAVVISSISMYVLFGIYNFFRRAPMEVYWYYLFLFFYSVAFLEEYLFRGIMQTKLEQALGQRKAVLYQAFLFILIHIPGNIMLFL